MNKTDDKIFDIVHDSQKVFSIILKAFSFPGRIFKIPEIDFLCDYELQKYIAVFGLTLLDFETTFHVIDDSTDSLFKKYIIKNSQAEYSGLSDADFIFVINTYLSDSINNIKKGSLIDPSKSAVLVYLLENIADTSKGSEYTVKLSGPGIKEKKYLHLNNFKECEIKKWISVNKEFPLGVDIVLISKNGEIAAIPRSIKIEINT
ncbi:MAG: phosphonate C-P lyase system protein PhnH [Spirochaetes bacterium]|nr:phosphonate C-P lyase system protein PhnH [Spirochaetota bacterium]